MPKHTPEQRRKKAEEFSQQVELGMVMRAQRISRGLKLYWVAGRMGITESYLSYLEAGKRAWPKDLQKSFLAVLDAHTIKRNNIKPNNRKVKRNGSPK